jgi:hypothetical protein
MNSNLEEKAQQVTRPYSLSTIFILIYFTILQILKNYNDESIFNTGCYTCCFK